MESTNKFSLKYYKSIIQKAKDSGYKFVTLRDFYHLDCPNEKHFVLRHDLDLLPSSLAPMLEVERECEVRSSIFVRVTGPYNPFDHKVFKILNDAEQDGFEIGLHTNFVEFAEINDRGYYEVLKSELRIIRAFFRDVDGISTHRDVNYMYNSLPFLEKNWEELKNDFKLYLHYQAYDKKILDNVLYVNEGLSPHLGWRDIIPEDAIETGKSICLLVHPHWWYKSHAQEHWG